MRAVTGGATRTTKCSAPRTHRTFLAAAVAVAVAAVLLGAAPSAGAAAKAGAWTERTCRTLVEVQAAGLDARDALWSVVRGPAPADGAARRATVRRLREAVAPVRTELRALDRHLGRSAPAGARGPAVRNDLRAGYSAVADAYAEADLALRDLGTVSPARVPAATGKVLRRLDAAIDTAGRPITRMERAVQTSSLRIPLTTIPVCRAIGPDWSLLLGDAAPGKTPAPEPGAEALPGAVDLTTPALLLPGRYRPPADIAALGAQTTMTGRARTYLYASVPVVETGVPFVGDCPSGGGESTQILGCFHDGRVYVLAITRPELAAIVPVVTAHEMLHAVHAAASPEARSEVDGLLSGLYATTTDARLQRIVAQYDARAPQHRLTELHSLVGTQVPVLSAELETYYADYFHDRSALLTAYDSYISLFEGLIARYDDLRAQLDGLAAEITALQGQAGAAAAQARSLATQIDGLRAQGRVAESNALVGAQNGAVDRSRALNGQANALIDRHNALVEEINELANQLGGLERSLRPLG